MRAVSTLVVLAAAGLCCPFHAGAQRYTGVAYYDADALYDTLPSRFHDDSRYTPRGALGWDTERYRRKIARTAAVIDSLAMPVAAVGGIENEAVARDLCAACRGEYCYLHRTLDTFEGLDFALLYYGDRFAPDRIEARRGYLYAEGPLDGVRTGILLFAYEHRQADRIIGDLRAGRPGVRLIVMGRCRRTDASGQGLRDVLEPARRKGRGTIRYRSGWTMRDGALLDTAFRVVAADVYARRFLLDPHDGAPMPTYDGTRYRGGYGHSLPIFVVFRSE